MKISRNRCEILFCAILFGVLGACAAGPTGYQKAGDWPYYGYRDKPLGGDEFSIIVTGNQQTSIDRVATVALLRAARLTQEKGRTHFLILATKRERLHSERLHTITFVGPPFILIPIGQSIANEPIAILVVRLLPLGATPPEDAHMASKIVPILEELLKGN